MAPILTSAVSSAESVDVLVVGGGPAGLAAAQAAASRGRSTLLLERNAELGAPVRTSGASWLADVRALGIPPHLAHPVGSVSFVAPGRQARWTFAPPLLCVLDVHGLLQHMGMQAAQAGAALRLRHTVSRALVDDGRVVGAEVRNELGRSQVVHARVTLDTTGHVATLATQVGLHEAYRQLGVGAEYELWAPNFDADEALLLVGREIAGQGYAWAFPRAGGRVRVGVGVLRPASDLDPRALLRRLTSHPALQGPLRGAQPLEYHTGVFPVSPPPEHLSMDGLLLAGDSSAQGSPLVGEGIRYAIRAGRLAGAVAADAADAGDCSAAFLRRYDTAWRRQFGREMAVSYGLHRRFVRYGDRNWRVVAALLGCLSPGQAAAALHGDYTASWWLGLALRAPWLASAALGALRTEKR